MDDPSIWVYEKASLSEKPYDVHEHEQERATQGFSTYDWWNFNSYLTFVIVGGLRKFLVDGNGYPAAFGSIEEWNVILEKMIAGFEMSEEIHNSFEVATPDQSAVVDEGMELFAKHYADLWD